MNIFKCKLADTIKKTNRVCDDEDGYTNIVNY